MRYLTLRHTPVTSLIGTLSLAASLFLAVVAAPAGATPPAQLSSQEKVNFEIAIKSDEELTTTITITSPASREKNLKEDCVQETFSQAATPPDITFTNDNGTPTCKATFTTPISRNNYVSHDGDEYVVDTHDDSAPKDGSADTFSLTVIFPGKVTESGGGKIEGDQQNEVSFSTFYGHKARGKDTAQAASQPSSTPSPSSTPASSSASSPSSTATPSSTSSSHPSGGTPLSATHSRRTGSRSTWMRWGSSRFRQALSSPPPRRSPSPLTHRQVRPPRSPAIRLLPSSTSPRTRRDRPPHRIFHRTTTVTAATEAENRVGITPVTYRPADQGDHLERPCTDSPLLSRRALSSPATSGAGESMVSHEHSLSAGFTSCACGIPPRPGHPA